MAHENTFAMESGGYMYDKRGCIICGVAPVARAFFYPTYMNGDAEWLGDYCKEHKDVSLRNVSHGKILLRYPLPEYPNVPVINQEK